MTPTRRTYFFQLLLVMSLVAFIKFFVLWLGSLESIRNNAWFAHLVADIWTWGDFFKKSQEGLIPYVDFSKEYPVGGGMIYWAIGKGLSSLENLHILWVHGLVMSVVDILTSGVLFFVLWDLNKARAFWLTLLFYLLPTGLFCLPIRFESCLFALVFLGYWCHRKNKPLWATALWSLGCTIKWYPIVFIAAQEWRALTVEKKRGQWWRSKLIFIAIVGLVNLPFIYLGYARYGNIHNWLNTYLFHMHRPLYWDTVIGVIQIWFGNFPWEVYASTWSALAMLVVLFWNPGVLTRAKPQAWSFEVKSILCMVVALLLNRIYSIQFNLWFYPMIIFLLNEELDRRKFWELFILLAALEVVNITIYPFSFASAYNEMGAFKPYLAAENGSTGTIIFSNAIILRALLLTYLCIYLWKNFYRDSKYRASSISGIE